MSVDYQARYDNARPTYTKVNDKRFADLEAGTSVLIPCPNDIGFEIDQLAAGEVTDLAGLRDRLAERHGADGACPVMTGMNLRVVAELSMEALDAGMPADEVVPVWKVITPKSPLAKKLPGGVARLEALRGYH